MVRATEYCPKCKKVMDYPTIIVNYSENRKTIIRLPMCLKCQEIEIAHRDLKKWFD